MQEILEYLVKKYAKDVPDEELTDSFQIIDEKQQKQHPTHWITMRGLDYQKITIVASEKKISPKVRF